MFYSKRFRVVGRIALSSVLGFGLTFWGFGCVPFSSQHQTHLSKGPCPLALALQSIDLLITYLRVISDIPGDPGSQLPYQQFSPYYPAPIWLACPISLIQQVDWG